MTSESHKDFIDRIREYLEVEGGNEISPELLESHMYNNNDCLFTWDLTDGKMEFRRGFERLLGHRDEIMTFERLLGLIPPEEAEYVKRIGQASSLLSIQKPEGNRKWTLYVAHRIKKADDSYTYVLSQTIPAVFDANGLISKFLVKLTDISFKESDGVVRYKFLHPELDPDEFHKSIFHEIYGLFTQREVEIITLIKKGRSSQEIADLLGISKNTVATHRKKILKKADCHSSKELLSYCERNGLLLD